MAVVACLSHISLQHLLQHARQLLKSEILCSITSDKHLGHPLKNKKRLGCLHLSKHLRSMILAEPSDCRACFMSEHQVHLSARLVLIRPTILQAAADDKGPEPGRFS